MPYEVVLPYSAYMILGVSGEMGSMLVWESYEFERSSSGVFGEVDELRVRAAWKG